MVGVFFSSEGLRVLIFEFTFVKRGCYKLNNLMIAEQVWSWVLEIRGSGAMGLSTEFGVWFRRA